MNKEEREKLKEQVSDMIVTGYTHTYIARKLGIGRKTINRWFENDRKETLKQMQATAEEQIALMEKAKKKRLKVLWTTVLDPKSSKMEKNGAIKLLQNEEVLDIKRRQMVGLLPKDEPEIAIQNTNVVEGVTTIADSIRRIHPELVDKFSKNKMKVIDIGKKKP